MATLQFKRTYHCFDDCKQSGCPNHELILTFQSVSNAYLVDNGNGRTYGFDQCELEALIDALKELKEVRADALKF